MIRTTDIRDLNSKSEELNITITLPTHRKGEEVQQAPIRLKNLVNRVQKDLKERGMKDREIEEYLGKARELISDLKFWNHTDKGLALYINSSLFKSMQLPYDLKENTSVSDQFLLTPLFPMVSLEGTWTMLSLNLNNIRLLRCTRNEMTDITPEDIITSMDEFLEEKPEAHLQFHTGASGKEAMYFGHGGNDEDRKVQAEKYLRGVEESVSRKLRGIENEPLILAGTEEVTALYRSINKYNRVLDESVKGNPDDYGESPLLNAGWEIIRDYFLRDMYSAIDQFDDSESSRTSENLTEIVEATLMGKTDTLLIARHEEMWGWVNEETHSVNITANRRAEDRELLNWTAIQAMEQGGRVFVLPREEMPGQTTVAALFRY
ncbi:MAG: hypothetical protein WDZ29_02505 [Balneolaceae bacterium]